jgi:hypothetical protein
MRHVTYIRYDQCDQMKRKLSAMRLDCVRACGRCKEAVVALWSSQRRAIAAYPVYGGGLVPRGRSRRMAGALRCTVGPSSGRHVAERRIRDHGIAIVRVVAA